MSYISIGTYDQNKAGHPEHYFAERHTTIDYRGKLKISPLAQFGYRNMIITVSHSILNGQFSPKTIKKQVTIDDYAWITSGCILYNCHIMHHAIISVGAVVSGMVVEPYTVVAGNPAVPIARWNGQRWEKLPLDKK